MTMRDRSPYEKARDELRDILVSRDANIDPNETDLTKILQKSIPEVIEVSNIHELDRSNQGRNG